MISLIVAVDADFGIGKDGQIPWYYTEDMKHFANVTKGSTCIMGRLTAEDILGVHDNPSLLPTRESIVVSGNESFQARDAKIASSLKDAIEKSTRDDIFIIGGAGLYKECLPLIDRAYITFIPNTHGCDVTVPEVIRYVIDNFECEKNTESESGLIFTQARRKIKFNNG